jgi:hypothetical protein
VQDKCQIVDKDGNKDARIKHGEWVVWNNELGADVKLRFPDRLFGVETAVAYASGEPLKLQVRKDAPEGNHPYAPVDIGTTLPGPIIIVPPGP